jgi:hypothetical protein
MLVLVILALGAFKLYTGGLKTSDITSGIASLRGAKPAPPAMLPADTAPADAVARRTDAEATAQEGVVAALTAAPTPVPSALAPTPIAIKATPSPSASPTPSPSASPTAVASEAPTPAPTVKVTAKTAAPTTSPTSTPTAAPTVKATAAATAAATKAKDTPLLAATTKITKVDPKTELKEPPQTTDIKLWLRSDLGLDIKEKLVTKWTDQAAKLEFVPSDATKGPGVGAKQVNGHPVIDFPCALTTPKFELPTQATIFFVVAPAALNKGSRFFGFYPFGQFRFFEEKASLFIGKQDHVIAAGAHAAVKPGEFSVISFRVDSKGKKVEGGGGADDLVQLKTARDAGKFEISKSALAVGGVKGTCDDEDNLKGQVAEVIVYDGLLESKDVTKAQQYLLCKWLPAHEQADCDGSKAAAAAVLAKAEGAVTKNATSAADATGGKAGAKVEEKDGAKDSEEETKKEKKKKSKKKKKKKKADDDDENDEKEEGEGEEAAKDKKAVETKATDVEAKDAKEGSKKTKKKPKKKPKKKKKKKKSKGKAKGKDKKNACVFDKKINIMDYKAPEGADFAAKIKWDDTVEGVWKEVRNFKLGGEPLRKLIHGKVRILEGLRHQLFKNACGEEEEDEEDAEEDDDDDDDEDEEEDEEEEDDDDKAKKKKKKKKKKPVKKSSKKKKKKSKKSKKDDDDDEEEDEE